MAKKGEKLKDVQVAPPRTYGLFDLPSPFKGAEFEFVAKPYGRTPAAAGDPVRRVIVRVESAKPMRGQTGAFPNLEGKNALLSIARVPKVPN